MAEMSWKQLHYMHGAIRIANSKGAVEINIERYNARLPSDAGFSENRIRADHLHEIQRLQRALKEVWDD